MTSAWACASDIPGNVRYLARSDGYAYEPVYILGEISAANGWDAAELQIVEARQLADDHDGSLPKPPPKKSLGSGLYTGLMKRMGRSSTRKSTSNGAEESTSNTA